MQVLRLQQQVYTRLPVADRPGYLQMALEQDDPMVRALAGHWALELLPTADAAQQKVLVQVLFRLSHDGSVDVQRAAVLGLGRVQDPAVFERLKILVHLHAARPDRNPCNSSAVDRLRDLARNRRRALALYPSASGRASKTRRKTGSHPSKSGSKQRLRTLEPPVRAGVESEELMKTLPDSANLDHLRQQAKDMLGQLRSTRPDAALSEAQADTAEQYGFHTWTALKDEVDRRNANPLHAPAWTSVAVADAFDLGMPRASRRR